MSFITNPRIIALSYSRIKTHKECPRKAKYKFIDRMKEPGNLAMDRGSEVHKQLEEYIDQKRDVPEILLRAPGVRAFIDVLREIEEVETEKQYAFDQYWRQTEWFSPSVYMRVVYDAVLWEPETASVLVVDHKTGKRYADHEDQRKHYAYAAFQLWPDIEEVTPRFLYIDLDQVDYGTTAVAPPPVFHRDKDFKWLQDFCEEEARQVREDSIFPTRPTARCNWCHFRRSNQGPCDHG